MAPYVPSETTRVLDISTQRASFVTRRCMLRVIRGPSVGNALHVKVAMTAGRAEDNDLLIEDEAASREHFSVAARSEGYVLIDLGSTNGTRVNSVDVVECRLCSGDIISVGETDVAFCEETVIHVAEESP